MLESEAQRKRAAEGSGFSAAVARLLNAHLRSARDDVVVARARVDDVARAINSELDARLLLKDLVLGARRPCNRRAVEVGNSGMLLALHRPPDREWRLLAAIESSVSLHARHTEVCFWALALRSVCRFVFVTEDRDVYSARRRSELGRSCEQSTAARRLLETFTDGVYLGRRYASPSDPALLRDIDAFTAAAARPVFDDPGVPGHTEYCERVRPLDNLIHDLRRWRHEGRPAVDFKGRLPNDIAELLAAARL